MLKAELLLIWNFLYQQYYLSLFAGIKLSVSMSCDPCAEEPLALKFY